MPEETTRRAKEQHLWKASVEECEDPEDEGEEQHEGRILAKGNTVTMSDGKEESHIILQDIKTPLHGALVQNIVDQLRAQDPEVHLQCSTDTGTHNQLGWRR